LFLDCLSRAFERAEADRLATPPSWWPPSRRSRPDRSQALSVPLYTAPSSCRSCGPRRTVLVTVRTRRMPFSLFSKSLPRLPKHVANLTDGILARHSYLGSVTDWIRSASMFLRTCTVPDGQRTSISSTFVIAPSPKWSGPALEEA
jgi:hypothetical protein